VTYTVYILRKRGEDLPRYIGQTKHSPQHRFNAHLSEARSIGGQRTRFGQWLIRNASEIEAVSVVEVDTRDEAKAIERHAIIFSAGIGADLFNRDHVPATLKRPVGLAA